MPVGTWGSSGRKRGGVQPVRVTVQDHNEHVGGSHRQIIAAITVEVTEGHLVVLSPGHAEVRWQDVLVTRGGQPTWAAQHQVHRRATWLVITTGDVRLVGHDDRQVITPVAVDVPHSQPRPEALSVARLTGNATVALPPRLRP